MEEWQQNEQELTHMWEGQAVLLIGREKYNILKNNGRFLSFSLTGHVIVINFRKKQPRSKVRYFVETTTNSWLNSLNSKKSMW